MEIEIPFKPDGKRPVFCKECLKDYQRAVAKVKEVQNQNGSQNFGKQEPKKTVDLEGLRGMIQEVKGE